MSLRCLSKSQKGRFNLKFPEEIKLPSRTHETLWISLVCRRISEGASSYFPNPMWVLLWHVHTNIMESFHRWECEFSLKLSSQLRQWPLWSAFSLKLYSDKSIQAIDQQNGSKLILVWSHRLASHQGFCSLPNPFTLCRVSFRKWSRSHQHDSKDELSRCTSCDGTVTPEVLSPLLGFFAIH